VFPYARRRVSRIGGWRNTPPGASVPHYVLFLFHFGIEIIPFLNKKATSVSFRNVSCGDDPTAAKAAPQQRPNGRYTASRALKGTLASL